MARREGEAGRRPIVDARQFDRSDDANAFLPDPEEGPAVIDDDIAQTLAEEFMEAATSGQEQGEEAQDEIAPEEIGGPFLQTTMTEEIALDSDPMNPPDATAEPLPLATRSLVQPPPDDAGFLGSAANGFDEDQDDDDEL